MELFHFVSAELFAACLLSFLSFPFSPHLNASNRAADGQSKPAFLLLPALQMALGRCPVWQQLFEETLEGKTHPCKSQVAWKAPPTSASQLVFLVQNKGRERQNLWVRTEGDQYKRAPGFYHQNTQMILWLAQKQMGVSKLYLLSN